MSSSYNAAMVVIALYISIVGINFASTDLFHKAYGSFFISAGVGIFFSGFFSGLFCIPQTFGIRRHNKFVLLGCFFADMILMIVVLTTGIRCYNSTLPEFPEPLRASCLRHSPLLGLTPNDCASYYRSTKTAGIRLAWASLFSLSDDPVQYQVLSTIQDDNLCCGFGPPLRCTNDTRPFPSDRPTENVDSLYARQRTVCGNYVDYYPRQENCLHYFDPNVIPKIVGGCEYDMALGECVNDDSKVLNTFGCADKFETYIATLVSPNALFVAGSSVVNFLSILVSCCMIWKRKDGDVFPDFINEEEKNKDELRTKNARVIVYDRIKDNVNVNPSPNILVTRGFLPAIGMRKYLEMEEDKRMAAEYAAAKGAVKDLETAEEDEEEDEGEDDQESGAAPLADVQDGITAKPSADAA